jgi:hypothetical protein
MSAQSCASRHTGAGATATGTAAGEAEGSALSNTMFCKTSMSVNNVVALYQTPALSSMQLRMYFM